MTKLIMGDVIFLSENFSVYAKRPYEEKEWLQTDEITKKLKTTTEYRNTQTSITANEAGEYVVVSSRLRGGGTGHGPHDIYPDGWYVTLHKLGNDGKYEHGTDVVSFYQSGCFTVLHKEDMPVIRRMKMTFM